MAFSTIVGDVLDTLAKTGAAALGLYLCRKIGEVWGRRRKVREERNRAKLMRHRYRTMEMMARDEYYNDRDDHDPAMG